MPNDVFIQNRANAPIRPEGAGTADNETYRFPFKTPHEQRMHVAQPAQTTIQPGETGREYAINMAAAQVYQKYPDQRQDRQARMSPEELVAWIGQAKSYTAHMIYRRDEFLHPN